MRRKDQREQAARSRTRHHPEVQRGSAEVNVVEGSESRKIYNCAGRDDASWYGGGAADDEGDGGAEGFLNIEDDQELN
jgi:hypothetical protein